MKKPSITAAFAMAVFSTVAAAETPASSKVFMMIPQMYKNYNGGVQLVVTPVPFPSMEECEAMKSPLAAETLNHMKQVFGSGSLNGGAHPGSLEKMMTGNVVCKEIAPVTAPASPAP